MLALTSQLDAIHALPLNRRVRLLNLSGDHERVITLNGLRGLMPEFVDLIAGPGCAATVCPGEDIYQAIRLAQEHAVTLAVDDSLLRIPVPPGLPGPKSLAEAGEQGADIRAVSAPIEASLLAASEPGREVVLFMAGFETVLAPLAGMLLDGLPDNLSLLLCGRRVEPLVSAAQDMALSDFDALLLPGNRCSVVGLSSWQDLADRRHIPVAVAGYTVSAVLAAIHAVLKRVASNQADVANCYRPIAKASGNPIAKARMEQVFDVVPGSWRGVGTVAGSAFRLRPAFAANDAGRRFPDYRQVVGRVADLPVGYDCANVVAGRQSPPACKGFNRECRPDQPLGPCMASRDGTCHVHSLAQRRSDLSVVAR